MLYIQEIPLVQMIGGNTKAEILKNADDLGIRLQRSARKAAVATRVADTILRHPLILMHHLPWHELMKLQQMVHDDRHAFALSRYESFPLECLTEIGLTDMTAEEDVHYEFIYRDMADALRPVIDNYMATLDPDEGKILLERTILGLLNLYGILYSTDLMKLVREFLPDLPPHKILVALDESFMFRRCVCYDADERLCYRSPFMDYPERYLQEFNRRHYQEKARFSPEEVLAAADMRAPQPPSNVKSAEMQRLVEPLFSSTEEMQAWIGHVWMFANNDLQVLETLTAIIDTKSMTREEVQRSFTLLIEWVNHFPRWILQGNTSHAIFELQKKQKPPIIPGPNLQKAGIRTSQKDINRMWEGNIRKVGRNDPCPCGSSKKYKHCCGTN